VRGRARGESQPLDREQGLPDHTVPNIDVGEALPKGAAIAKGMQGLQRERDDGHDDPGDIKLVAESEHDKNKREKLEEEEDGGDDCVGPLHPVRSGRPPAPEEGERAIDKACADGGPGQPVSPPHELLVFVQIKQPYKQIPERDREEKIKRLVDETGDAVGDFNEKELAENVQRHWYDCKNRDPQEKLFSPVAVPENNAEDADEDAQQHERVVEQIPANIVRQDRALLKIDRVRVADPWRIPQTAIETPLKDAQRGLPDADGEHAFAGTLKWKVVGIHGVEPRRAGRHLAHAADQLAVPVDLVGVVHLVEEDFVLAGHAGGWLDVDVAAIPGESRCRRGESERPRCATAHRPEDPSSPTSRHHSQAWRIADRRRG
jgi:hypothetical protein